VLFKPKVVVQLGIQGRLNGDLGQHLPKFVKILFGLDVLRGDLRYRL